MSSSFYLKESHKQHQGEVIVAQRRAVSSDYADFLQQVLQSNMPKQHSDFFSNLPYFPICTVGVDGRVWGTILVKGKTQFVTLGKRRNELVITTRLSDGDPFQEAVLGSQGEQYRYFAAVGMDFSNRRRNKVSGFIIKSQLTTKGDLVLHLRTTESMGNCPKYITVRRLEHLERVSQVELSCRAADSPTPAPAKCGDFPARCRFIISQASTTYLSSMHYTKGGEQDYTDIGMNHRGGAPGFMRVLQVPATGVEDAKTFLVIPDYAGNNHFQSLGNVETGGDVGVTVPDFHTGDVLFITGHAVNLYDTNAAEIMPQSTFITRIEVKEYVYIRGAMSMRLVLGSEEEMSPYNPPVKLLSSELEGGGRAVAVSSAGENAAVGANISAKLVKITPITDLISTFSFELSTALCVLPGGFVVLDFSQVNMTAFPMYFLGGADRPQDLNEDYIRSWTVTSPPVWDRTTRRFSPSTALDVMVKHKPRGLLSSFLHRINPAKLSSSRYAAAPLEVRVVGTGGTFSCFEHVPSGPPSNSSSRQKEFEYRLCGVGKGRGGRDRDAKKMLWLAGGVGITPFLSIWNCIIQQQTQLGNQVDELGTAVDVVMFLSCRGDQERAMRGLFPSDTSAPHVRCTIEVFDSTSASSSVEHSGHKHHRRRFSVEDFAAVADVAQREVYMCGPPDFLSSASANLERVGVPSSSIKQESFLF